jgi:hypothetical protein
VAVFAVWLAGCGSQPAAWRPLRPSPPPEAAHPLRVSKDGRHLEDARGKPFLVVGDAAWSVITALTKPEAEQYLEDRRRRGFNTILVNLIEHKFNGPRNRYGHLPFGNSSDFSQPNPEYFEHADWVLRKAAEKGFVVLLVPCYLGYAGTDEGWFDEVLANGVEKCKSYARYVAARYRNFENLIWVLAGDREPGRALPHVQAMAEVFQTEDSRRLRTAHLAPEVSTRDVFGNSSWVDFNLTYTYNLVHAMVLRDYYRTPLMPTLLIESHYEGEHGAKPDWIRRQAYAAVLNGAVGHVMGNRPVWLFDPGWQQALASPAAESMRNFGQFFAALPWHTLVPDFSLVWDGQGNPRGQDSVSCARNPEGTLALIYLPRQRVLYVPARRTFTVDTRTLTGDAIPAWWFDPRKALVASAGSITRGERRKFETLTSDDWILGLGKAPPVQESRQ